MRTDPPGQTAMRSGQGSTYLALALMYFAQGAPVGLAGHALGVLVRHGGYRLDAIGLTALAPLPWAVKFLWAGTVDNACRRWGFGRLIGVTQWLVVCVCLALVRFPPDTSLYATVSLLVVLNTLCATQDTVTNAYAVTRLRGRRAGVANGIQVAGFISGMLVGGGGMLLVYDRAGWHGVMMLFAALMAVMYLPLVVIRHRFDRPGAASERFSRQRVRLRDLARRGDLGWAVLLAFSYKSADTAMWMLVQPWLVDRGFGIDQIGRLQMLNLCCTAVGGIVVGIPLVRWFGNRGAVRVSLALASALVGTAWWLQGLTHLPAALVFRAFALKSLFDGGMYVTIWALFMNWASPERPAAEYTSMQCCESLNAALATGVIGAIGQRFGYAATFMGLWIAAAAGWFIVAGCLPRLHLPGRQEADGQSR